MFQWKKYLIVAGFLLLLVVVQFRNPEITGPYKGILGNILNPFVYAGGHMSEAVSGAFSHYVFLSGVSKENDELKSRLERVSLENAVLSEKLVQLDNLNKLLGFKDVYAFNTIAANVVGRNVDGYISYIIIDRGTKDGIKEGDPVVSFAGLVGKVMRPYYSTSLVVVMYHHDYNVSVINSRTRAVGILKGDGRGGLYVDYYDRLDNVSVGDKLVTSGLGELYPKGIAVGAVDGISAPVTGLFQKLSVACAVDFYKLEQVLIVIPNIEEGVSPPP